MENSKIILKQLSTVIFEAEIARNLACNIASLELINATLAPISAFNTGAIAWEDFRNLTVEARTSYNTAANAATNAVINAKNAYHEAHDRLLPTMFHPANIFHGSTKNSLSEFLSHDEDSVGADGAAG